MGWPMGVGRVAWGVVYVCVLDGKFLSIEWWVFSYLSCRGGTNATNDIVRLHEFTTQVGITWSSK